MGSGRQWISWIHLTDVVRIVERLIEDNAAIPPGPVNTVAPNAVRQAALSRAFMEAVQAPKLPLVSSLATPEFVFRLLMGSDRAPLVLEGQRVVPKKLLDAGFEFHYPRLEDAFEETFGRRPGPVPLN